MFDRAKPFGAFGARDDAEIQRGFKWSMWVRRSRWASSYSIIQTLPLPLQLGVERGDWRKKTELALPPDQAEMRLKLSGAQWTEGATVAGQGRLG